MSSLRTIASFWLGIGVVLLVLGCEPAGAPDPAERARRMIRDHGARAADAWRADRTNWDLGLSDEVAGAEAQAPWRIVTIRDLWRDTDEQCSEAGNGPLVYRTLIVLDRAAVPICSWRTLDEATAGHRWARALAGRSRGSFPAFREALEKAEACRAAMDPADLCSSIDFPL